MGWGPTERTLLIGLAMVLAVALAGSSWGLSAGATRELPSLIVDANTAPSAVFEALPGLGPALAGRIVEARELSPFRSLDDLDQRVKGIGPAKVAAIRPYLQFEPPTGLQP